MIAAILLAATISSPSIGEFMTLPSWMPRSVSASHTPGNSSARVFHRLDPNMAAAMAAVEEAFWERYYFLHGLKIPAEYLELGLETYYLDPDCRNLFPTQYESPSDTWWSYPTNRIAFPTRRISETNYLTTVKYILRTDWNPDKKPLEIYDHIYLARDSRTEEYDDILRPAAWSSTLFGDPAQVFPAFDWTEVTNLVDVLSSWRGGRMLTSCTNSPVFNFFDDEYPVVDDVPPGLLPYGIYDLAPPFDIGQESERRAFYQAHKLQSPGTFDEVLSRAFGPPAPDYALLTNGTTRILYDRLAAANQVLAALNRTYHTAYPDWSVVHSNASYSIRQPLTVTLPANAFSIDGGEIKVDGSKAIYGQPGRPMTHLDLEEVSYYDPTVGTEGVHSDSTTGTPLRREVYYRLNPDQLPYYAPGIPFEGTNTFRVGTFHSPYYDNVTQTWIVDADLIMTCGQETNYHETATIRMVLPISDVLHGSFDTIHLSISVVSEGGLFYPVSDFPFSGLSFPNANAFTSGRVAECEVASVGTILYYTTNEWGDVETVSTRIKVDDDTVADWSALYDFAHERQLEYIEKLRLDFADKAGFYPQPAGLVDFVDRAHYEAMDNLSAKMSFSAETSTDTSFSPSGRVVYKDWERSDVIFDGSDIICGLVLTVTASQSAPDKKGVDYRNRLDIRYLERVDWNWKALRLSTDNEL